MAAIAAAVQGLNFFFLINLSVFSKKPHSRKFPQNLEMIGHSKFSEFVENCLIFPCMKGVRFEIEVVVGRSLDGLQTGIC